MGKKEIKKRETIELEERRRLARESTNKMWGS